MSLILLHKSTEIALILALTGTAVLVGIQQLRYDEFGEMLSILQRATRRRQIIANHVAVRHAAEMLGNCHEFSSICRLLRDTLQPVGFDGIRFQMLHPNGYPAESFRPLNYEPDGKLLLSWSDRALDDAPWELRLDLVCCDGRWGYLSLIRVGDSRPIGLDVNVLAGQFRAALSNAVKRACDQMEPVTDPGDGGANNRSHKLAAGSNAD